MQILINSVLFPLKIVIEIDYFYLHLSLEPYFEVDRKREGW